MTKKRRFKIKFKGIMVVVFVVLLILLAFCIKDILDVLKNNGAAKVEILDTIEKYDYSLNENDSEYFKENFKELKKELKKDKIDEENYASIMSKLFVADFFSLNNAINKNDVGGIQFIYTNYQSSFLGYAKDTIYKYVENNIYKDRNQELPVVIDVEVSNIEKKKAKYKEITDDDAYYVDLKITYEKDLQYQSTANIVIVHNNNKLEIAEMK